MYKRRFEMNSYSAYATGMSILGIIAFEAVLPWTPIIINKQTNKQTNRDVFP